MWSLMPDVDPAPDASAAVEVRRGRRVAVAPVPNGVWLGYLGGAVYIPRDAQGSPRGVVAGRGVKAVTGTQHLRAPMAGRIVEQHAAAGARCRRGETLVVLEAMKMEYKICAPADGRISATHGAQGAAVALDAVLVTLVCDAPG